MSIMRGFVENCSIIQMNSGEDMEKKSSELFLKQDH